MIKRALTVLLSVLVFNVNAAPKPGPTSCPPVTQAPSQEELAQATAQAKDRGFLWRISKDGVDSYLFGSIHVGKLEWAVPGPELRVALKSSKTMALELDPGDPAVAQEMSKILSKFNLKIDAKTQARLNRQANALCVPPASIAKFNPLMQAITLILLSARWDGLDAAYAQEHVLSGFAHSVGVPVVSLETVKLQMDAMFPNSAKQATKMLHQALEQLENGKGRPVMARLANAWAQGDLADLESYESWCECADDPDERALLHKLNDERNPYLAQRIETEHTQGGPVFAAVGALHMTGPQALPKLLAARGFKVTRISYAP